LFNLDPATAPSNNLPNIDNIIDPLVSGPGINLPAAANGQRYLIINNNIGNTNNDPVNHPSVWRNADNSPFYANENDIVQFDGSRWTVSFDSQNTTTIYNSVSHQDETPYVTNLYSGIQLKWVDGQWQVSWEGQYKEGYWLLII
jgi:hypothetical protein